METTTSKPSGQAIDPTHEPFIQGLLEAALDASDAYQAIIFPSDDLYGRETRFIAKIRRRIRKCLRHRDRLLFSLDYARQQQAHAQAKTTEAIKSYERLKILVQEGKIRVSVCRYRMQDELQLLGRYQDIVKARTREIDLYEQIILAFPEAL